ncbi:hypothetical protein INH39_05115 [Massilia violaceinigra]|uniref:Uncharacterized protein n=1 Tax=Massilia violaceinigra TaxID=2045208 RepID=A0ABY4A920_9BURK|nr:hypothetical protein [Massilia violaceinigra]UOD31107.1 hypothetical protein INH39_05115 [Massilia violaceinigra]
MAHRWKTPGGIWLEHEHTAQFELAPSEGPGRIARLPAIAHLPGAPLRGSRTETVFHGLSAANK